MHLGGHCGEAAKTGIKLESDVMVKKASTRPRNSEFPGEDVLTDKAVSHVQADKAVSYRPICALSLRWASSESFQD